MPYGRTLLTTNTVNATRVSADGRPCYKSGGITLDLTTVPAASGSDVTLPDGSTIKANNQYLRYGQIMTKITTQPVQTITGTATSGTGTISVVRPDTGQTVTTASLGFAATAAQVLTALQAVLGANQVASATGGPLGTGAVTVTFNNFVPIMTLGPGSALAGGTWTFAVTTSGASNGKYGPYDSAASDGRQTLTRGECYILDETWLLNPAGGSFAGLASTDIIGGVFDGGEIFLDRVLQSGVVAHSLTLGPTKVEFLAAFPLIKITEN
jgi:hypothetical protein